MQRLFESIAQRTVLKGMSHKIISASRGAAQEERRSHIAQVPGDFILHERHDGILTILVNVHL